MPSTGTSKYVGGRAALLATVAVDITYLRAVMAGGMQLPIMVRSSAIDDIGSRFLGLRKEVKMPLDLTTVESCNLPLTRTPTGSFSHVLLPETFERNFRDRANPVAVWITFSGRRHDLRALRRHDQEGDRDDRARHHSQRGSRL
ncbi:hypothetical protein BOSE62_80004 [Bosea sp. 62]|nr:hypothetical protein BOSE21B_80158 [Bosea sp. 21B]CAD5293255.1 hypothetical protein BOSE46_80125 [Bosea sp. 46]CAD5299738.1 hypothetical protein BOSE7B_60653 [Bosea sp. 7B]VVT56999.1 hypothetical protein BOS5A_180003 [Bosea sp. EC-HK365B]VXB46752.1 hypothetical protein BOSE127_120115 [Bosea sp. 127]VXC51328.1 hypothetical protein BOSE125_290004 [Bosea sp. 125]VXC70833.1 hypothetical protein BOSE29B_70130 [Bosea sp. 29B]VXC94867.1 hypothetical protein BOSE62_80004 [Bosea sp. 62]